jgi:hypothetical protein|tara:strand:+ start:450 stop:713 length:264 start_codon:yes stop_codon:yes gene_type:complete
MNIIQTLNQSIIEFNKSQDKFKIINDESFELIGQNSLLDSMAIVNFLLLLENKIFENHNIKKNLMNDVFINGKGKLNIKSLVLILNK